MDSLEGDAAVDDMTHQGHQWRGSSAQFPSCKDLLWQR
jgi:hypothetical protein